MELFETCAYIYIYIYLKSRFIINSRYVIKKTIRFSFVREKNTIGQRPGRSCSKFKTVIIYLSHNFLFVNPRRTRGSWQPNDFFVGIISAVFRVGGHRSIISIVIEFELSNRISITATIMGRVNRILIKTIRRRFVCGLRDGFIGAKYSN